MTLALKSLIDWHHPRRIVAKNDFIILPAIARTRSFILSQEPHVRLTDAAFLPVILFFSAKHLHWISTSFPSRPAPCELICLPLSILEATLSTQSHLARATVSSDCSRHDATTACQLRGS